MTLRTPGNIRFPLEPALRRRVAILAAVLAGTVFLSAIVIDILGERAIRQPQPETVLEPRPAPAMLHPLLRPDRGGGEALLRPGNGHPGSPTERVTTLTKRARRLCDAGNFTGAMEFYQAILDLDPHNIEAQLALGSIALYQRRYATAEKYLAKLLQELPHDDPVVLLRLGSAQFRRGKIGLGLSTLKRAFRLRPNDGSLCFELACAYAVLGDRDRALFFLEEARKALGGRLLAFIADHHLDAIRQDSRFQQVLRRARADLLAAKKTPPKSPAPPPPHPDRK